MKKLLFILTIPAALISCRQEKPVFQAPLLEKIGNYSVDITTQSPYANQFFTQGLIMANAFNHGEAARSFHEAVRLDSGCAMGWWGIAYVLGPNYNTSSNLGESDQIREAVNNAVKFSNGCTDWERALIGAIAAKFPEHANEPDENAYADAMRDAFEKFNNDDLVITLYAESMMNMHAWDLYTRKGGEPKPWTAEIVGLLEAALKINPQNPLANHLYLHATEAAPDVEKALASAERLKTLVPAAGHLVHMPSHIYINTGDYHEGSIANEKAVIADSIYIAECNVQGIYPQLYYPHNYHFLSATAALEGRGARSIEAAYKTASIIDEKYLLEPGYETVQHYVTIPNHVLIKFSQWEKILSLPKPKDDLKYPLAMWHYARGMAYANTNQLSLAKDEFVNLVELKESSELKGLMIWEINSATDVCNIATHILDAEIAMKKGMPDDAIFHLKEAIAIEDQLNYNEPPDWFFSVRHILGEVYMELGRYAEAESVYREDLTYWVNNGFALNGLHHSLKEQGKVDEANEMMNKFTAAWKYADSELKYSRVDESKRKNLALKIDSNSPSTLLYLADAVCINK
ncbi:MAG TPA: hypothetical protein VFW11_20545 [Cyclobacteriaceae bacterium]|nr:hypothetical protein [Cyclobacteriaceae bacterium]